MSNIKDVRWSAGVWPPYWIIIIIIIKILLIIGQRHCRRHAVTPMSNTASHDYREKSS